MSASSTGLNLSSPVRPAGPNNPTATWSVSAGLPSGPSRKTRPVSKSAVSATCREKFRPMVSTICGSSASRMTVWSAVSGFASFTRFGALSLSNRSSKPSARKL